MAIFHQIVTAVLQFIISASNKFIMCQMLTELDIYWSNCPESECFLFFAWPDFTAITGFLQSCLFSAKYWGYIFAPHLNGADCFICIATLQNWSIGSEWLFASCRFDESIGCPIWELISISRMAINKNCSNEYFGGFYRTNLNFHWREDILICLKILYVYFVFHNFLRMSITWITKLA